jgi:hypothetical protein
MTISSNLIPFPLPTFGYLFYPLRVIYYFSIFALEKIHFAK